MLFGVKHSFTTVSFWLIFFCITAFSIFFLFFFGMARWLTLCPNSVYWMDQLFNILGELLSQLGKGAMVTLDPLAH